MQPSVKWVRIQWKRQINQTKEHFAPIVDTIHVVAVRKHCLRTKNDKLFLKDSRFYIFFSSWWCGIFAKKKLLQIIIIHKCPADTQEWKKARKNYLLQWNDFFIHFSEIWMHFLVLFFYIGVSLEFLKLANDKNHIQCMVLWDKTCKDIPV